MNRIARMRQRLRSDGWLLFTVDLHRRIRLRIFSFFVMKVYATGPGLRIHPSCRLIGMRRIKIGDRFSAGRDLWLEAVVVHGTVRYEPRIEIGDSVAVSDHVHIAATNLVRIGHGVLLGSRVFVSDHSHGSYSETAQSDPAVAPNDRMVTCHQSVVIGDNVWIGDGAVILPGSEIGEGAVIGANAVVRGAIPPRSIAVGVPARVVKTYTPSEKAWVPK